MLSLDVLIAEDDAALREALTDTLELAGYQVAGAANGVDALACLEQYAPRLLLSDVQMAPMDGFALLDYVRHRHPELPVVLMTAYGTIPKAVQAMQAGACDYLVKPFEVATLLEHVARHMTEPAMPLDPQAGVAVDVASRRLYALAAKVAASEATVLIQGESGTGKEVLARYLHAASSRSAGPFVAINCAAIPDTLLEALLFGYEKGAFTGAQHSAPGKFELAQGGSLLLDEVTEMPPALQAKLLRVLQEKEVERLGGRKPIALDVRVIATTNRALKDAVAQGQFREDLYYRLNVFPLTVAPLRDRRDDIVPLALALLQRHAGQDGKALPLLTDAARQQLRAYAWPGNVRELDNVIQRALILQEGGRIDVAALVFESSDLADTADHSAPLQHGLRSMEEKIILDALREEKGARKATAQRLGISERTLRYKIARLREAGAVIPD